MHVTTVWQLRQFIRSRNQVKLFVSLFELVGAFLDFFFQQFSVCVQFFNLPLDCCVHLVEYFGEASNFILAALRLEFSNIEIPFGNLGDVVNQVVERLTDNQDLPERNEQNGDDGTVQNNAAHVLYRRDHRVDFSLGLQSNKAKIVGWIEGPVDEVGFSIVQLYETNGIIAILLDVHVAKSEFRNLVDSVKPSSHIRVVKDFALAIACDENAVLPDFVFRKVFPESANRKV